MLRTDTRAQSIQVGAVLLFGVLIILLSTWQAFGIPNQNEGIEFNHNQDVQKQMTELRTTVNSMPDASVTRAVTLDLGVRYPSRTIFTNPPPAAGTVRTVDTDTESYAINITGEPVDENLAQLWNETDAQYNTGAIEYSPQYSEYQNPPKTIYEHSVVFNKFEREDTTLSISGQSIIEGDQITLVFLNGSLSENRVDSTSVDFEPTSTQTRTVVIEPKDGNVTLDIPTRLDVAEWRSLLNDDHEVTPLADISGETDQFASNDNIQTIRVEVDANRENGLRDSYRLQLAKVGIGTDVTQTEPAYITDVDGDQAEINEDETRDLTVEVRDEYNNPKRGVTVNASATNGELTDLDNSKNTNSAGQATFEYNPGSVTGAQELREINFSIVNGYKPDTTHDSQSPKNLTVGVTVNKKEQSSISGDPLPGPNATSLSVNPDPVAQGEDLTINATFNNQGETIGGPTVDERAGVPVVAGEYYIVKGSVDDPTGQDLIVPGNGEGPPDSGTGEPLELLEDPAVEVNTGSVLEITEADFDPGSYTVFVRGQDTRAIWTNESTEADGYTSDTFVIEDKAQNPLPEGYVAFADENGNGEYDEGEDRYTEGDFVGTFNNKDKDIVIRKDITAGKSKIDIKANTITVQNNATLSTTGGKNLVLTSENEVDISGAILDASGKNADIEIIAGNSGNTGDVIANDAIFRSGRDITVDAKNSGTLFIDRAVIEDQNGNGATLKLVNGDIVGDPRKGDINS